MAIAALAIGAVSSILGGSAAKRGAQLQAEQLDQQAGQTQAVSQLQMLDQNRETDLVKERAQAVAAASGGGASDPSVVNTISRIAGEGEYRALTDKYQGDINATSLRNQAISARSQGQQAQTAGYINAAAQVAGGAAKYGAFSSPTSSYDQAVAGLNAGPSTIMSGIPQTLYNKYGAGYSDFNDVRPTIFGRPYGGYG